MFFFLAQTIEHPWWITAITGSGGALVVLMLWVKSLTTAIKNKDDELIKISRESIECITKVIQKQNQDRPWKEKMEALINDIHACMKTIGAK
jgi:hypothetical protein